MPKKISEDILQEIERIYLSDSSQSYASLAKRFNISSTTLETYGKQRGWARKRDQQRARLARKVMKNVQVVADAAGRSEVPTNQFDKARLLKLIQKGLNVFDSAFDLYADNPRVLGTLAAGLERLVQLHIKIEPLTISDMVEVLIASEISPEQFLDALRSEQEQAKEKRILKIAR